MIGKNQKLPNSWVSVKLGEFVDTAKGKKPKNQQATKSLTHNLPYVDIKAFEEGIFDSWTDGAGCRLCSEDDFLMVWDGSRSGLVGKGVKGALGSTLVRINFPQMHNNYAYYFLLSKYQEINTRAKGSGTPHVDPDLLWNYNFPIAPLNEQRRIVAKIETLFSELDDGIASLKTAKEQLKVYRQAVLKHAFEGKLTAKWREENNIGNWRNKKLDALLSFLTSGSRSWADYYSEKGDIFIRAQNLKHDFLDLSDIAYVSLPNATEGMRTKIQKGDVLITITGANVTKSAYVERNIGTAFVSQHVALCRPTNELNGHFLYLYLIAETGGRKQLTQFSYGAGKPGLNLGQIRSVIIPLPCIYEQAEIVNELKEKLSTVDKTLQDIDDQLKKSETLRQSILKKAFAGQLVAQDPNDEPASKLLERIKANKDKESR